MKKVYIVLTYTGTILSRIVKRYTRKEYSHVSLSLDENLNEMYSFGRLYAYNPFLGGFVRESTEYGTFKRFHKQIKTKIYALEVNEKEYEKIKRMIKNINNNKNSYRFNVLGLMGVVFDIKVKRKRCFYCAEFVKHILDNSCIEVSLPDIIKPDDFRKIKGIKEVYSGLLDEYNYE